MESIITSGVEQVTSTSPPVAPIPMQTNATSSSVSAMQQSIESQPPAVQPLNQVEQSAGGVRKSNVSGANGMMSQDLMNDHDLLSYLNGNCFDTQNEFIM